MTAWKDMTIYERFIAEFGALKKVRSSFDASRKEIAEQYRPDIVGTKDKGKFTGSTIVEGTGPWALGVMTRGLLGSLAGPSFEWIRYETPELFFKGDDSINQWLQHFKEHMAMVYRLSTFYDVMPNYVSEGLSIGSPTTIIEEDILTDKNVFHRPLYDKCWFGRDKFGVVDVLYVEHEYTVKTAADRFGKENLSKDLQRLLTEGQNYKKSKFLQIFYSPDDPVFNDLKEAAPVDLPDGAVCAMFYIEQNVSEKEKQKPLSVAPYFSKPYTVWDYSLNPGEICARTPAWGAMPDTKGHQAIWTTIQTSSQKQANPAMWLMGNRKWRLGAGGLNYARSAQEFQLPPEAIFTPTNQPSIEFVANTSAQALRRHFFVDVFKRIEEYQRTHNQPPSATEIVAMEGENAPQIGPAVQSVERRMLGPIDERMVGIEDEAGRLPVPPDIWLEFSEKNQVNPIYVGPISVAQKTSLSVRKLDVFFAIAERFITLDEMLKHKLELPAAMENALEDADIPQTWLKSQDAYEAIIEQIARQDAQRELIEQAGAVAEGAQKISGPVDETSPLAQMQEAV